MPICAVKKKFRLITAMSLLILSLPVTAKSAQLFGNFRGSINHIDDSLCGALNGNTNCQTENSEGYDGTSFQNNASVLGIKAEYRHNDLEAFATYILRAQNDGTFSRGGLTTIIYQAGVRGTFGEVSVGVGSTPYKKSGQELDPFWDTSASARGFDGPVIGLSDLTWGFSENLLQWNSAKLFDRLALDAAIVLDDSNADQHDYNLGARFMIKNYQLGAQYLTLSEQHPTAKSLAKGDALRLWGKWQSDSLSLTLSLEKLDYRDSDNQPETNPTQNHWMLALEHTGLSDHRFSFSLGRSDTQEQHYLNGQGASVGWFYTLMPQVEVYTLASYVDRDQTTPNRQVLALGINYSFSLKN